MQGGGGGGGLHAATSVTASIRMHSQACVVAANAIVVLVLEAVNLQTKSSAEKTRFVIVKVHDSEKGGVACTYPPALPNILHFLSVDDVAMVKGIIHATSMLQSDM